VIIRDGRSRSHYFSHGQVQSKASFYLSFFPLPPTSLLICFKVPFGMFLPPQVEREEIGRSGIEVGLSSLESRRNGPLFFFPPSLFGEVLGQGCPPSRLIAKVWGLPFQIKRCYDFFFFSLFSLNKHTPTFFSPAVIETVSLVISYLVRGVGEGSPLFFFLPPPSWMVIAVPSAVAWRETHEEDRSSVLRA